ncbi:MAG: nitric-oxide reductase [Sphingobacteriales bacterium 17-39-43]|uniref:nitric-oxide reductase large subunit n=1 Tax=Daejeonella sp. TaxID=2805397 RepID=UPI000BCFFAB7|nr:cbb3-type cytochrome c oxidase subunit I [Daejeonella sp.]OYZ28741.1 MAG: nitric-oxide reductase [Sphingobacteriales bacterium 16-39-50]OZA22147.1 MAG: nitric-oxide reductase [Sphingobacteriales bacterium 17-39-43]HQT24771.1 cbb3-type cytochrome c oxidase subunit I [Daejeonella sp.]HQT59428.1 cbb3-type cytochrome c oxidase subunit I [Daejeonella sp.]
MSNNNTITYLLNPKNWWLPLLIIFIVSICGVAMIGIHTYTEAPPIPNYVTEKGKVIISKEDILKGQAVFQEYALMEYGSMFGDGANRGPDYTAEALHRMSEYMNDYYKSGLNSDENSELAIRGAQEQVKYEIKANQYDKNTNSVKLADSQVAALSNLEDYYKNIFTNPKFAGAFKPMGYIKDEEDIKSLSKFFFWGAWVCGVERPGETYSYTHNWPFDPSAGNTPTSATIIWSIIGSLGLLLGLGIVLYYYGRMDKLDDDAYTNKAQAFMTKAEVAKFAPDEIQHATFKYFYVAILLFGTQVLAGILTVHDFVGFVNFFGFDISKALPVTITRSWHVQLSLLWISACWIGASFFMMSLISPAQAKSQVKLINTIFWLTVLLVAGSMVGMFLGPHGLLAKSWYWLGHQGWEYVELGKIWQIILGIVFIIWAITIYRGIKPVMKVKQPWALPNWLVYTTFSIILLLISGFIATPNTNFVIADFWRWMVVHMWAEAFFEVFTTVLIGYFMVLMGLISKQAAIRVIYLATLLFLGSGLLGISHNFYWNAKPVGTMALGAVFSTLQVVPLVLLTLEAWRFSKLPKILEDNNKVNGDPNKQFGFPEVFLFLVAVNFWNFFGAGVLGFIINLPIANYYEHGTYLTVNHGHAALMGVYGNLALATVLFCSQLLIKAEYWRPKAIRTAFWSINIGLLLMVLLDLFPAGILQFQTVTERGLWFARSAEFIDSTAFQNLTWLRIIGGSMFTLGGVIPLMWFVLKGAKGLKRNAKTN